MVRWRLFIPGLVLVLAGLALAYQNAWTLFEMEGLDGGCTGQEEGGDDFCRPAGMVLAFVLVGVWNLVGMAGGVLMFASFRDA